MIWNYFTTILSQDTVHADGAYWIYVPLIHDDLKELMFS